MRHFYIFILTIYLLIIFYSVSMAENSDEGIRLFYLQEYDKAREVFDNLLNIDSQNPIAHYFLGLIEYQQGNIVKAKAYIQIAHGLLNSMQTDNKMPIDEKHVRIEFPEEYKVMIYYKDGWYIMPKEMSTRTVYTLETGSNYKIKLEPPTKSSFITKTLLGVAIAISLLLMR